MNPEKKASVLFNTKETLYPTNKVMCQNKLHDVSESDSRYADGRCKICRLASRAAYRKGSVGHEARKREFYTRFKTRLLIRMIAKQNTINELERQLNDKEVSH